MVATIVVWETTFFGTLDSSPSSSIAQSGGCNPPPFELAYPPFVAPHDSKEMPTPLPMTIAWEPQLTKGQIQEFDMVRVDGIVARGSDEIWIAARDKLVRFTPSTKDLVSYIIKTSQNILVSPDKLYLSKDNTLWVFSYLEKDRHFFIGRYNPHKDVFENVYDSWSIFAGPISRVIEHDERFFIKMGPRIIQFDLEKGRIDPIIGYGQGYNIHDFAIDSDGKIWMNARKVDEALSFEHYIFQYDSKTGNIREHGVTKTKIGAATLFFDHLGRLWLNAKAWFEIFPNGDSMGYTVFSSPIFVYDSYASGYVLTNAFPIHESLDRFLWFNSSAGVAVLDLDINEWCLMTRFSSPIAEDTDHNIWVTQAGQLYKFPLEP